MAELIGLLGELGFEDARVTEQFDPFAGTSKEATARKYGVVGVNISARRP